MSCSQSIAHVCTPDTANHPISSFGVTHTDRSTLENFKVYCNLPVRETDATVAHIATCNICISRLITNARRPYRRAPFMTGDLSPLLHLSRLPRYAAANAVLRCSYPARPNIRTKANTRNQTQAG